MSRKKALKGAKGGSKSPKASPCKDGGGKSGKGAAAASGGAVHPSAPSISSSGGFYDVAFKVREARPVNTRPPARGLSSNGLIGDVDDAAPVLRRRRRSLKCVPFATVFVCRVAVVSTLERRARGCDSVRACPCHARVRPPTTSAREHPEHRCLSV